MKLTKEFLEKAKAAASAEEIIDLAKTEGFEIPAEDASKLSEYLSDKGEISDDLLEEINGGAALRLPSSPKVFKSVLKQDPDINPRE